MIKLSKNQIGNICNNFKLDTLETSLIVQLIENTASFKKIKTFIHVLKEVIALYAKINHIY